MAIKKIIVYSFLILFFGTLFYLSNNYVYNAGDPMLPWHPKEFLLAMFQAMFLLIIPFLVNMFFKKKSQAKKLR